MHTLTPPVAAPVATRVRAYLGHELVADSRSVMLLRESPFKLFYCFPRMDIRDGILDPQSEQRSSTSLGPPDPKVGNLGDTILISFQETPRDWTRLAS